MPTSLDSQLKCRALVTRPWEHGAMNKRAIPQLPQEEGLSSPQTKRAHSRVLSFDYSLPSFLSGIPWIGSWC